MVLRGSGRHAHGMTSAPPPPPAAPPPPLPPFDPPAWQSPPPYGPPTRRPQLRRSRSDKILGGVNGGLAEYTGIDALLWRVGFVALTLAGGAGIVVYLLLWLLMPAGPPAGAEEHTGRRERPPLGPRSPVPGLTIAALLILMGALALFTTATPWTITPVGFFGVAVLVVGLGLVAAAFAGGRTARGGLIALGIVLSLALFAAASEPWEGTGAGDRTYRPGTAAAVQDNYSGGVGDLTLDLTRIDMGEGTPIRTQIDHGMGDLQILVPLDADIEVTVESGLGSVDVFGEGTADGYFAGRGAGSWVDDGDPEIILTVHAGVGDVEVSRG
jgi:phage shock protein PspC (stress-responsive transcriptional regulator)